MQNLSAEQRLERFKGYLQQDSRNATLMIDIARLHLELGQRQEALGFARDALAVSNQLGSAHAILAAIARQEGDHAQALDHLERAAASGEHGPTMAFYRAHALAHLERYEEAEPQARQAAASPETCPHAPALYIRTLQHLGRQEEAVAYALTVEPNAAAFPQLQGVLATLFLDAGLHDKAAAAAEAALSVDAADADAATTSAFLALGELDSAAAAERFSAVLRAHPQQGRAHLGLGLSHLLAGDLHAAVSALDNATRHMANHLGTWQALAWCHILNKNADTAEKALLTALELDHNFSETHGGLAIVALMRGRLDLARECAKRAIGLDREGFTGLFALSLLDQMAGDSLKAQQVVEQILTQPVLPNGKSIHGAVAGMLISQGAKHQ